MAFGLSLMFLMLIPIQTEAQGYQPLSPIDGTLEAGKKTTNLNTYISGIYKTAIAIASVLAVFMIFWGGVTYMTTDAIEGKKEGKNYITNAIVGLLIIFGSYLILNTVNPSLVGWNLDFGNLKAPEKRDLERLIAEAERAKYQATLDKNATTLDRRIENYEKDIPIYKKIEQSLRDEATTETDKLRKQDLIDKADQAKAIADIKEYMKTQSEVARKLAESSKPSDQSRALEIVTAMFTKVDKDTYNLEKKGVKLNRNALEIEANKRIQEIAIIVKEKELKREAEAAKLKENPNAFPSSNIGI